ncbi:MAG: anaerobic ribonucleoside-triphosphate reductase activating protein [Patescibacteria group bacterium]|nr:anaerobic ribonucleoside-triphosphate reductase activating protein [Patescibacteria group bacterium]
MQFNGFQKTSLIEWPGKIVSIVWVAGCNFRCPFCYNRDLVLKNTNLKIFEESKILEYLEENKNLIDGLMITGGEPTLQPELADFLAKVHQLNLKVGVESNATRPEIIENLLKNKLVDYLAVDIKAPLEKDKYKKLTGVEIDVEKIKKSIKLIKDSDIEYEFRTTIIPGLLNKDDILEISQTLKGAQRYVIQRFIPQETMINHDLVEIKPYSKEELLAIEREIKDNFQECYVRGLD